MYSSISRESISFSTPPHPPSSLSLSLSLSLVILICKWRGRKSESMIPRGSSSSTSSNELLESICPFALLRHFAVMFSMMVNLLKKKNKKNKEVLKFEPKEEYFIKNGGILLEKQIALSQGQDIGPRQLKIFSSKDIQKATNCYDSDLAVGSSSSVTVYKGLVDNRTMAIKTPQLIKINSELRDLFLTEVSAGMVMDHVNMVKIYGCCLDTCVPMPVYEFVSRGSLFDHIHGRFASRGSLLWADRLRVLIDVSYALSYMHNALSKPVVHRVVNSLNILLGELFCAKLANFAYSVVITPGDRSQRWPIEGTPGYIDPEYVETQEVTDKCDVYSFGVLMLELLTRKQPLMMAKDGMDLVDEFVFAVQRNCMGEMLDNEALEQGRWGDIEQVARLALRCVEKKAIGRPTMVEVVSKLWEIRDQHNC